MSEPATIFTVMVFDTRKDHPSSHSRVWGWFPTFEEAHLVVSTGDGGIYEEGTYQVALIEEVPWGVMGGLGARDTWWFAAKYKGGGGKYKVTKINEPHWAHNIVHWTMG